MNLEEQALKQLALVLEEYEKSRVYLEYASSVSNCDRERVAERLLTQAIAAIERITGARSIYMEQVKRVLSVSDWEYRWIREAIGIVEALKFDVENGFLGSLYALAHAEVFTDYLDMADNLLASGYKDAAAVMIGSTLESHLRRLAIKNEIDVEVIKNGEVQQKKASVLNSDLKRENVYGDADNKLVTAWLAIRNYTAHGHYDEYTLDQVRNMNTGVRDFIRRYPA